MAGYIQSPRGMHDVLGADFWQKKFLVETFQQTARRYGFEGVETPLVENAALFQRTVSASDIVTKEMFALVPRGETKGQEPDFVLRPEGTAPVMRAVLQHGLQQNLPLKWFYSGPMFRYDRPQKGRLRQFHQVGLEHLGSDSPLSDIEIIAAAHHFLHACGLTSFKLKINTLGCAESRKRYAQALKALLLPYQDQLSEDSKRRLQQNTLRILDSKNKLDRSLLHKVLPKMPPRETFFTRASLDRFNTVLDGLRGLKIAYQVDPCLVRGLDYYTDTAFEFKVDTLGAQDTILAGGRFDGLCETLGGPVLPGIGWAAGVERLLLLMKKAPFKLVKTAVLPCVESDALQALQWSEVWRQQDMNIVLLPPMQALPKRLKKADALQCDWAVIIGETERRSERPQLKNLISGVSQTPLWQDIPLLIQQVDRVS